MDYHHQHQQLLLQQQQQQQLQQQPQQPPLICGICNRMIDGQFVKAMNGHYHMNCFRCPDCQALVAEKFFPLQRGDGITEVFCEKDYYARMGLSCFKCTQPLRTPHINALGRKYHPEHFCCHICNKSFGAHDLYFEKEGEVYCKFHYSHLFASKCGGCQCPVLKKFVEMSKDGQVQQWHPECFMIYKLYSIRVQGKVEPTGPQDEAVELARYQAMEDKVSRIITTLTAFEGSSAECIGDMLMHFSAAKVQDSLVDAARFIGHVNAIFLVVERVDQTLAVFNDETVAHPRKEPKQLSKKIVQFFSVLSTSKDKDDVKSLITLVTNLAAVLKVLIRSGLSGALRLERKYGQEFAVNEFLDLLMAEEDPLDFIRRQTVLFEGGARKDLCLACQKPVEEACMKLGAISWHIGCFKCASCDAFLKDRVDEARYDPATHKVFCGSHSTVKMIPGVVSLSQYQQYSFLLASALHRLSMLVNNPLTLELLNFNRMQPNDQSFNRQFSDSAFNQEEEAAEVPEAFPRANAMPMPPPVTALPPNALLIVEQSLLDRVLIRQQAVKILEKSLTGTFTPAEIAEFGNIPKRSWKFNIRPGTKSKVFGVPLDLIVEKLGVESDLGQGPSLLLIPRFVDLCIRMLKSMDLSVEGIFRKNGNIRRLKTVADELDAHPEMTYLNEDNPIQVAALLKKFLRDLPEPLLTFRLFPLFIASQRFPDWQTKKHLLHLALCLLPKPNLDLLQVLVYFLREVSLFSKLPNGSGNKMDLYNISTCIAPNILYSKNQMPADDESMLAIKAFEMIILYQDELRLVPANITLEPQVEPPAELGSVRFGGSNPYETGVFNSNSFFV